LKRINAKKKIEKQRSLQRILARKESETRWKEISHDM
jgi:hypothetical protein